MRSICSAALLFVACGKSEPKPPPPSQPSAAPVVARDAAAANVDAAIVDAAVVATPPKPAKVVELVVDARRACVRRDDGRVRCWGYRLGEDRYPGSAVPLEIPGLTNAADIAVDLDQLFIITTAGTALRTSLHDAKKFAPPHEIVKGATGAVEIIDGHARFADGSVRAFGQRVQDGKKRWVEFEPVPYLANVVELRNRAVRHRDGTVTWFGFDDKHEAIEGLTDAVALVADNVARRKDGSFVRWNISGGDRKPSPLTDLPEGTTALAFGEGFQCALAAGAVWCKGANDMGQLGTGDTARERDTFAKLELPAPATAIDADSQSTCAILETGALACWGGNPGGQLGDGSIIDRNRPVIVDGATSAEPPPHTTGFDNAGSGPAMDWTGLPKSCTKPTNVIDAHGNSYFEAVSAYAYTSPYRTEITLGDFHLDPAGYDQGRMPARGKQRAIEIGITHGTKERPQPLRKGRYQTSEKENAPRSAGISKYAGEHASWAMLTTTTVDVTHLDRTWICGTYTVAHDPEEGVKPSKPVTRAFAARLAKDPW